MNNEERNIESGRQEIWRRQILLITCLVLSVPFCLFIVFPLDAFWGELGSLSVIAFYGLFVFVIGQWYSNTPCPNCGKGIMTKSSATRYRSCTHCGIDLRPQKINYSISLKKIPYVPRVRRGSS
ncbi:MAG: transposase [Nanoarchaeota archaeon]|nr:transposase [Nanoarchaeota archaeon]